MLLNSFYLVLANFDNWERALEIYNTNFTHKAAVAELQKHPANMVIGGPPCQDFSHAGKRKEEKRAEWLVSKKALTKNSADDVVSRIKRAKSIMEIDVPLDIDTLLFHFIGKPAFKALTRTVRSQLKRAIKLYKEFNSKI